MKILGLDIGSHSTKGILITPGVRAPRLLSHFERGTLEEAVRDGLSGLSPDQVIIGVSGQEVITRLLFLPFTDPEKIGQVIPYELEGQIPVDLDEIIIDHQVVEVEGGRSRVLVTAVQKRIVERCLETLRKVGIDPVAIEAGPLALANFYQVFLRRYASDLLLVDMGASRTSLCVIRGGRPCMIRTILGGGRDVTKALAAERSLSFDEAETLKLTQASVEEEKGIRAALDPLLSDIERTLSLYEVEFGQKVPLIYLCGGGSRLTGIGPYCARTLEREILSLSPEDLGLPGIGESFATSLGLAVKGLTGTGKGSQINLRKGEYAPPREDRMIRRRTIVVGILTTLLLVMGATNLSLRYRFKEGRYQDLKSQLRVLFRSEFPQVGQVINEVEQAKVLLAETKRKTDFLGSGETTPLKVLTDLTRGIPPEIRIDVYELVIEGDKIRIEAETQSFEAVDRIKGELGGKKWVKEITVSDAKLKTDQSKVSFRITMTMAEGL